MCCAFWGVLLEGLALYRGVSIEVYGIKVKDRSVRSNTSPLWFSDLVC